MSLGRRRVPSPENGLAAVRQPAEFNPDAYPRLERLGWRFGRKQTEVTTNRELGEALIAAGLAKRAGGDSR